MLVDDFLELPYFNQQPKQAASHRLLKAEVDGRVILNHEDSFGVCAEGGDNNKGEVFLIFRGTTMANKKADVLTDARIGLSFSSTSRWPVHSGFQHCFESMLPAIRSFFTSFKGSVKTVHCIGHSLLVALFITSVFKAHPRTHNPKNGHFAEYAAGFILFTTSITGLYYLWS